MNAQLETSSMDNFFKPSSVVVIGASNASFNLGANICKSLKQDLQYRGRVYAVNRGGEAVYGAPGFRSVTDIPDNLDLAVIITPAAVVPKFVNDCGEKGIHNVIIESSGFSEQGPEGKRLQVEIDEAARAHHIRVIGPNCMGILDSNSKFCCFYGGNRVVADIVKQPGSVSYVIQSGGVASLLLARLAEDTSRANKVACIGNKSDVDESDLIDYFAADNTEVIALYLENVVHGAKLMASVTRAQKPVVVFKSGRTEAGSTAATSHTAGIANNDAVFESACKKAGMIRLKTIDELYALPKIFTDMPPLAGNRIALFTNSGAFGAIGADLMADTELTMARFSASTVQKLSKLSGVFNAGNPVDIGPAQSQLYLDIYEILLSADEVDGLLHIVGIWRDYVADAIEELVRLCRHYRKPAAIYTFNAVSRIQAIRSARNIPLFTTAEEAVRALVVSYQQSRYARKKGVG
jgi:acyl-CoA synthetase (NDP forming)